jgi:hypothetical protein
MGGFILYENEYPKEVLDYDRLAQLLQDKYIDVPTITERELQDRSKGDTISKVIVVLQTTWFVFQCIERVGKRLPLSELEVLTLAFAVVNVAIYGAWWNKPQGVDAAICVPLKRTEKDIDDLSTPLMGEEQHEAANLPRPESAEFPRPECRRSNDNLPVISTHGQQRDEHTGKKHSWLRRIVQKDREQHSSPFFLLLRLPYRIFVSVLRPLKKVSRSARFEGKDLRVPMFYTWRWRDNRPHLALCVIGLIVGAIHLIAWASEFPSPSDLVLWRVSAIGLTVVPFLLRLTRAIATPGMDVTAKCITGLLTLLVPFYVASRFMLIIIALLAIRHPPRDVLRDVSWTSYIPHF